MDNLQADLLNPGKHERFPAHGWARNSNGVKLLFLPIVRLTAAQHIHPDLLPEGQMYPSKRLTTHQIYESMAFRDNVVKLVRTLRELHHHTAQVCFPDPTERTSDEIKESRDSTTMASLFTDLAFTYLRRIADQFTRAIAPVLFEHVGSAPQKFKNLRKYEDFGRLEPNCNISKLRCVLESHTDWFDKLRDPSQGGIRDILEHHMVSVSIKPTKRPDPQTDDWLDGVEAVMDYPGQDRGTPYNEDLTPKIEQVITGLSRMWTGIAKSIDWNGVDYYTRGFQLADPGTHAPGMMMSDGFLVASDDEGTIAFWPEIQ